MFLEPSEKFVEGDSGGGKIATNGALFKNGLAISGRFITFQTMLKEFLVPLRRTGEQNSRGQQGFVARVEIFELFVSAAFCLQARQCRNTLWQRGTSRF